MMKVKFNTVYVGSMLLLLVVGCTSNPSNPGQGTPIAQDSNVSADLSKYTWYHSSASGETGVVYYDPDGNGVQFSYLDSTFTQISGFTTFGWTLSSKALVNGFDTLKYGTGFITPMTISNRTLTEGVGSEAKSYSIHDSIITGSIRGQIFDENGNVVPGASISIGATDTVTDVFGKYSFTGLAHSTETVTPSLAGYVFVPPSSKAPGSGAINVDFQAQDTTSTLPPQGSCTIEVDMPRMQNCVICYNTQFASNQVDSVIGKWLGVEDNHLGYDGVESRGDSALQKVIYSFPCSSAPTTITIQLMILDPASGQLVPFMNGTQRSVKAGQYVIVNNFNC